LLRSVILSKQATLASGQKPDMQIIRKAKEKDLGAIHNLVRELAIFEKAEDQFTATLAQYLEDYKNGVFDAIVAELDGEVIGMALYYYAYSTWRGKMLYLEDFVVDPAVRSRGTGRLLFDHLVAIAKAEDCKLMKWQVLDWNTDAQRFYHRVGAEIQKEWWNGVLRFTN